jgi:dihydroflavonol-4-reductase
VPTLVTGATGFLGTHLVRELRAGGETVRVLVRSIEAAAPLREYGVGVFPGDILDADSIRLAAHGCERVFHLAGIVSHEPRDVERIRSVNVEGTRTLLASVERGARVVHVSSVATLGPVSSPFERADESCVVDPAINLPYALTKREAEVLALEAAAAGADVVVANPGFLIGPGDVHRVSTWPIDAYLKGRLRFTTRGGLAFTDARDVAVGLIALAEHGRAGERTILSCREGNLTWDQFFLLVGELHGQQRLMVHLPTKLAALGARVIPKPVSAGEVRAAGHWWFNDPSKAERELGFHCRPILETIADTIADHRLAVRTEPVVDSAA